MKRRTVRWDKKTGELILEFDYRASRSNRFSVGLGDEADDKGLALDPLAAVDRTALAGPVGEEEGVLQYEAYLLAQALEGYIANVIAVDGDTAV